MQAPGMALKPHGQRIQMTSSATLCGTHVWTHHAAPLPHRHCPLWWTAQRALAALVSGLFRMWEDAYMSFLSFVEYDVAMKPIAGR
jgi:hypothetical protein